MKIYSKKIYLLILLINILKNSHSNDFCMKYSLPGILSTIFSVSVYKVINELLKAVEINRKMYFIVNDLNNKYQECFQSPDNLYEKEKYIIKRKFYDEIFRIKFNEEKLDQKSLLIKFDELHEKTKNQLDQLEKNKELLFKNEDINKIEENDSEKNKIKNKSIYKNLYFKNILLGGGITILGYRFYNFLKNKYNKNKLKIKKLKVL